MAPFSLAQTVYMLSLGANFLFEKTGDREILRKKIRAYLGAPGEASGPFFETLNQPSASYQCLARAPGVTGPADWQTAWGPQVFKHLTDIGAANTVFVAFSRALKTYVVAIAGTNPSGCSAIEREDLHVDHSKMRAWPPEEVDGKLKWSLRPDPKPEKAAVSQGTSDGLSDLYELEATSLHSPAKPESLKAFLSAVASKDATLVFTGHSLGGALSPTLALLLCPKPEASGWGEVHVLATAGPTPGNAGLGTLFRAAFPPKPIPDYPPPAHDGAARFTKWNVNYADIFDVVPRAWDKLDGLVTKPEDETGPWPSFFAGGATLGPLFAASTVAPILNRIMAKAGYGSGKATPYYEPPLEREEFSGVWGHWLKGKSYPPVWKELTPPIRINAAPDLSKWILNAHLPQYSYAFLGTHAPADQDQSEGDLDI